MSTEQSVSSMNFLSQLVKLFNNGQHASHSSCWAVAYHIKIQNWKWKCSNWKCSDWKCGNVQIGNAQIGNIKLGNAKIGRMEWPSLATIEIGLLPYNSQRLTAPYL